ncbi:MAG: TadE family type IV pilus minor pilin [Nocardioidaceae bacterium]
MTSLSCDPPPSAPRQPDSERGSVTAEAALVLPLMAVFAISLIWLISIGIAHVQAVDAARDAARELARGGDAAAATARALETAPAGSRVEVGQEDGLAQVEVTFAARPPGWLLVPLPSVDVTATSAVAVEDQGLGR